MLREAGGRKVAVGYDGRLSSPMLEHALIEGLNASGCDVVRVGMGPTPMLYYAEASAEEVHGGIQITGSHNPANYNGFKMVFMGRPFFGEDILEIGRRAQASLERSLARLEQLVESETTGAEHAPQEPEPEHA